MTETKNDVYQIVTDRVVELLERGTIPWREAWAQGEDFPSNLVSGKKYRGINVWLLSAAGYGSPYWVSAKQCKELGGEIRADEWKHHHLAVFWKRLEVDDKATGEKKFVPLLRYYRVFNVEQCDGLTYPMPEARTPDFNPIAEAERIANEMPNPPTIAHNEPRAFYRRSADLLNMPKRELFDNEQEYYSTLFHELTHATGHEKRVGRLQDDNSAFGSTAYAKEELIAEMGAAYLSATAGILHRTIDNSAAYINGWLERLKNDRKLVVNAASAAHRATDYIFGVKYEQH